MLRSIILCCIRRIQMRFKVVTSLLFGVGVILYVLNIRMSGKQMLKITGQRFGTSENNLAESLLKMKTKLACEHPNLPLYGSGMSSRQQPIAEVHCGEERDWVYTSGGKFYISKEADDRHGHIVCNYIPIFRGGNDDAIASRNFILPMVNGTNLTSDYFKVICKGQDGKRYANVHAAIAYKKDVYERHKANTLSHDALGLDVLIFGLDSMSRQKWQRELPRSHDYFTTHLGGVVLEGYNIVGDGTPQALIPLLTGKHETELPEVRRGKPGARHVDIYPFIWRKYREAGYVTQWGEDMANVGTFNLRMLGFENQPVDHYMRPFYLQAISMYRAFKPMCLGGKPRHRIITDWITEAYRFYRDHRKFVFGFFSEISHAIENGGFFHLLDVVILEFLTTLATEKLLNNTVLVVMSDHGPRFHDSRRTEQGKLEERMPYFGFRFPKWFYDKYPAQIRNVHINAKRLTTPFDIHKTLLDILKLDPNKASVSDKAISLFNEIPAQRTCEHAHIEPHWCACLQWKPITFKSEVKDAVKYVVGFINSLLSEFHNFCHKLNVQEIKSAKRYSTNKEVLHFKESADDDGRVPIFTDIVEPSEILYQITFTTSPGGGMFDTTVKYVSNGDMFKCSERDISRINAYGDAPSCIVDKAPHVRPYCVCFEG